MRRALLRISILSLSAFFILWGVIGLMICDGDYDFAVQMYIALACAILGVGSLIGRKLIGSRCTHCGKLHLYGGKFCSHCGKQINND